MARIEVLRGFGKSLRSKLGGLSRMQKWYGVSQESSRITGETEGPADELIRKKATGRFRGIT